MAGSPHLSLIAPSLGVIVYCTRSLLNERRAGQLLISPISLYSMLGIIHFGFPGVLLSLGALSFEYSGNLAFANRAIIFILFCLFCFFLGIRLYRITGLRRNERKDSNVSYRFSKIGLFFVVLFMEVSGWLARYYVISNDAYFQVNRTHQIAEGGSWHVLVRFSEQLPIHAYVLILLFVFFQQKYGRIISRKLMVCAIFLGSVEFIYWFIAGRKQETIMILLYYVFIRYLILRRLPSKKQMGSMAIIIMLIFPINFYYRYVMDVDFNKHASLNDIADVIRLSSKSETTIRDSVFVNRLYLLEPVSACVRLIDQGEWELREGIDYLNIPGSMIPRIVWENKPEYHYGTRFGHDSGMLYIGDSETSISVTFLGESYLNFWWLGCLVFLFFGYGVEIFFQMAVSRNNPMWCFYYLLVISTILYVGSTATMTAGGLLKQFVLFSPLFLLVKKGRLVERVNRPFSTGHLSGVR